MAGFKGSSLECRSDYFGRFGSKEALVCLADFTGISPDTASRWLMGGAETKGERQLRLRAYLHLVGYSVREFDRLGELPRRFVLMIGFGMIGLDEAVRMLGYTTPSSLYHVVLEGNNLLPDKVHKMRTFVGDHARSAELDEKVRTFREEFRERFGPLVNEESVNPTPPPPALPAPPGAASTATPPSAPPAPPTFPWGQRSAEPAPVVEPDDVDDDDTTPVEVPVNDFTLVTATLGSLKALSALTAELDLNPSAALLRRAIIAEFGTDQLNRLLHSLNSFGT